LLHCVEFVVQSQLAAALVMFDMTSART
jgi:hypothetical protein